jgi:hypothetical protein
MVLLFGASKIRDNFIHRGGGPERTNRFNKVLVLQLDVQKYIAFLQGALHEYHSGWQMDDYFLLAPTKQFQSKMSKVFKHDVVYNIWKRKLPKFELEISNSNSRAAQTLLMLDNDAAFGIVCMSNNFGATSNDEVTDLNLV